MGKKLLFVFGSLLILLGACSTSRPSTGTATSIQKLQAKDLFDPLLADGFDFPVGNREGQGSYTHPKTGKTYHGWYVATHVGDVYSLGIHPGEDWNGKGGGHTDLGQPVYSTAKGKVVAVEDYGSPWGKVVLIEHRYVENAQVKKVFSQYAHFQTVVVQQGEVVRRRQRLGTIGTGNGAHLAHLHFEMRRAKMKNYPPNYWPSSHGKSKQWVLDHYFHPTKFIQRHRKLKLPKDETDLLVAVKHQYKMFHYQKGKLLKEYEIALSQNPVGHKEQQGDLRLPEGEYAIVQKSLAPFKGMMGPYFGVAWIRLNYPNRFDAEAGYEKKLINRKERDQIIKAHQVGKTPPKNTKLGGGIGIHGWLKSDWKGPSHLTWGCISMHNHDLKRLYGKIALGTSILILP